jgi:hypothetical protein
MRTIKLTHEQHRIWRTNAAPTAEGELGARDKLKKELLERTEGHTFRLMSPMARFLGTVRGENSSAGTGTLGNLSGVPAPDSCVCKGFAGTRPGEHHDVCQHRAAWNAWVARQGAAAPSAPNLNPGMTVVSQKVAPPMNTQPQVKHMMVPKQVSPHSPPIRTGTVPVNSNVNNLVVQPQAVAPAVIVMISPEQCDCRQFTKPSDADPKQHHFICEHYDKWKTAHPTAVTPPSDEEPTHADTEKPPPPEEHLVLVDLDTRAVLRDATAEEIETARAEEEKTGSPIITLDDVVYGVVNAPVKENVVTP